MNTKKVFSLFMVSLALHTSQAQTSYPWMDTTKSFYERALLLCKELTLREKVDRLVHTSIRFELKGASLRQKIVSNHTEIEDND